MRSSLADYRVDIEHVSTGKRADSITTRAASEDEARRKAEDEIRRSPTPAGPDNAIGLINTGYLKDPTDHQWDNHAGMKESRDFSRETVMKQAENLHALELPTVRPRIKANTSHTDHRPIKAMQLEKWDGQARVLFGDIIEAGS
jgi:hypothetical protein